MVSTCKLYTHNGNTCIWNDQMSQSRMRKMMHTCNASYCLCCLLMLMCFLLIYLLAYRRSGMWIIVLSRSRVPPHPVVPPIGSAQPSWTRCASSWLISLHMDSFSPANHHTVHLCYLY